jgi:hypothetical protein
VWSWGYNLYGQLGNNESGSTADKTTPQNISEYFGEGVRIIQVSAGEWHSLALDDLGRVWSWGYNLYGQLGNGDTNRSNQITPQNISVISDNFGEGVKIVQVSAGRDHSLALDSDGEVWAWGRNTYGQLGNGDEGQYKSTPQNISAISGNFGEGVRIVQVSAGETHGLALDDTGDVWAWGNDGRGQLGNGSLGNTYIPQNISAISSDFSESTVVQISAIDIHSLALDDAGRVWAWGYNEYGQLGNNSTTDAYTPQNISEHFLGGATVVQISAGKECSLAVDDSGRVWSWGRNANGRLGNNTTTNENTPQNISEIAEANSTDFANTIIDTSTTSENLYVRIAQPVIINGDLDVSGSVSASSFTGSSLQLSSSISTGNLDISGSINVVSPVNTIGNLITNSSGVGIGTNSPDEKLHVAGNLKMDDPYLYLSNATLRILPSSNINTHSWFQFERYPENTDGNDILDFKLYNGYSSISTRTSNSLVLNKDGGNVGIGTSSPSGNLHISDTGNCSLIVEADSDNANENDTVTIKLRQDGQLTGVDFGIDNNNSGYIDINSTGAGGAGNFHIKENGANKVTVHRSGLLEVHSYASRGNNSWWARYYVYDNNIDYWRKATPMGMQNISVEAPQGFWTRSGGFWATSDSRIKDNITTTNKDDTMSLFRQLNVKNYTYKDFIGKPLRNSVYGFIAQEVSEIFPDAVSVNTDFIPNVYSFVDCEQTTSGTILTSTNGNVFSDIHTTSTDGNLNIVLKLYEENEDDIICNVLDIINESEIVIDKIVTSSRVFVFGQQVNDLYTVNKDMLFSILFSATKEYTFGIKSVFTETASGKISETSWAIKPYTLFRNGFPIKSLYV